MDPNFSDDLEDMGETMQDEMETPEVERIPCRLYPVRDKEQTYVLPVPGLDREGLESFEYHVDELEDLLEFVCHYSDREGAYYGFQIQDEQTMERALNIETLVPVSPEQLGELMDSDE